MWSLTNRVGTWVLYLGALFALVCTMSCFSCSCRDGQSPPSGRESEAPARAEAASAESEGAI